MGDLPLVSCLMPTYNRRRFVPLAVRYFLSQDYPEKELVVVDDGTDCVEDLIPPDPRVRYMRTSGRARVGAKRNLACELARGAIVAHWDDDDWAASTRLSMQIETLLLTGTSLCGARELVYLDPDARRGWRFTYPPDGRHWLVGSTLCYLRELWVQQPFREVDVGEDSAFVLATPPERVATVADCRFQVGILHRHNVSGKRPRPPCWRPYPVKKVKRLLGPDWADYVVGRTPVQHGLAERFSRWPRFGR
jgi:glycosyltransferase involved in cell wall biosynthesis